MTGIKARTSDPQPNPRLAPTNFSSTHATRDGRWSLRAFVVSAATVYAPGDYDKPRSFVKLTSYFDLSLSIAIFHPYISHPSILPPQYATVYVPHLSLIHI